MAKRVAIDTSYLLVESAPCPSGYLEVKNEGSDMDFQIPTGTLVIGSGEPGTKIYHLCRRDGVPPPPLLPPVR